LGCGLAVILGLLAASAMAQQPRPSGAPPQAQGPPANQAPQQPQGFPAQGQPPQVIVQQIAPIPNLPPPEVLPTVALSQLVERVARSSNKQFVVAPNVPQQIFLGGVRVEDVTYPILLAILRNHGVAAATIEGRVNLVPDSAVRSLPVPSVNTDDAKIADEEFVQRVITTSTVETPMLVPLLRPLLPQSAHLAAMPPNKLIVLDRYSNVKRISEIVKALDR
jgi:type II secretory pathway component GspD/PulD (secretin)